MICILFYNRSLVNVTGNAVIAFKVAKFSRVNKKKKREKKKEYREYSYNLFYYMDILRYFREISHWYTISKKFFRLYWILQSLT